MRIVLPQKIETNAILSSSAPLDEEPLWQAGSYSDGDRVVYGELVYAATTTTSDRPDLGTEKSPETWVALGVANRYRMFRQGVDSLTVATGDLVVELKASEIANTLGILNCTANAYKVEVISAQTGTTTFEIEDTLVEYGSGSWWEHVTSGLTLQSQVIISSIVISHGDTVRITLFSGASENGKTSCGMIVLGEDSTVGETNYGTTVGIINFTNIERDAFGSLQITPRRSIPVVEFNVSVDRSQIDYAIRVLRRVANRPALFIGSTELDSTIIYGIPEEPRIPISSPTISELVIEVQGV